MLKVSSVVILDETTAFADPENEEKMLTAMKELVRDKTLLVIIYCLQTTMDVDNICVIDNGRIVDFGKYNELLKCSPQYRKLWAVSENISEWKVAVAGVIILRALV